MPDYRGATLASGVRGVVRKQGFTSQQIYKAERELKKAGLIDMGGKMYKNVKLTAKGRQRAKCASVKLAPWTDAQYPGSALTGTKCRYGKTKRGTCRVRPKRRR